MKTVELADHILYEAYGTTDAVKLVTMIGKEATVAVINQSNFLAIAEILDSIVESLDKIEVKCDSK